MMRELKLGSPYTPVAGKPEGVFFEASSSGFELIYNYARPTAKEIQQMQSGEAFQIAYAEVGGAIWILSKVGSLEWSDAPFHPALSSGWQDVPLPEGPEEGTALTVMLTDAASGGTIKSLRAIGLGHDFSVSLILAMSELSKKPFDRASYFAGLDRTMAAYTTKQLVDRAEKKWRLRK